MQEGLMASTSSETYTTYKLRFEHPQHGSPAAPPATGQLPAPGEFCGALAGHVHGGHGKDCRESFKMELAQLMYRHKINRVDMSWDVEFVLRSFKPSPEPKDKQPYRDLGFEAAVTAMCR